MTITKKIFLVVITIVAIISIFVYRTYILYKVHFERGNEFAQLGKYEQAISEYKKSLKYAARNDVNPYYNMAKAHLKLEQYDKAIAIYKEIISVIPNDAEAYRMLAATYALDAAKKKEVEELREALRCIKKAFELAPFQMSEKDRELLRTLKQQLEEE
ncbi:MAG: tetratricopeptide repeat protein [Candidatus Omnitrophica bacterium]|nr:tetratricopeptide repeat protein [Candidatus Omnitrophota bacterium]